MKKLRRIEVGGQAPEDTLFDKYGNLYSGLKDGNAVVRIDLKSGSVTQIAQPGGRPLGLDWLPDGRLLLCNSELGLQAIDIETGVVEALPVHGKRLHLCNNAHVLSDRTIIVSDSSSVFTVDEFAKDLVQNTKTGRLLKVSPDGKASVLVDGLCFANGVVVIEEKNVALVAATGTCNIMRVDLQSGEITEFAEVNGHPDNMSIGSDGRIWVAVPSVKNEVLERVHTMPVFLRKLASSLPPSLQPKPQLCCRVEVFDTDGNSVEQYEGDPTIYNFVTGVRERNGLVALGSIEHDAVSVFELD